jgi:RNA-directed DNA polymerase
VSSKRIVARNLAHAFLAGPWSLDDLMANAARACGRKEKWLRPLVRRALASFGPDLLPDPDTLAAWIEDDRGFGQAWTSHCRGGRTPLHEVICRPAAMTASPWPVPPLPTPAALADWLGLTPAELDWFADRRGLLADIPPGPLRHYTYHWLAGRRGKYRLLEMPKRRLKALQRRLLHEILERLPAHDAVHSYRRGRSVASYVAPHAGRGLVLRFDLRDFFPSVRAARVHALFRTAGYPVAVARLLTGLCTGIVPDDVLRAVPPSGRQADRDRLRALYREPHLPQGAPTSPALANLCAYRLDCRLAGLARDLGASYTRYADDLAFSGGEELERSARRFQVLVCRIALEEGFEVNTRKSRFMRQGVRQQLAGVVLNAHPNVSRPEYERLKATLCNCVRHGPASQNRAGHADFRGHLAGRIAYVAMFNPARGQRLRDWFDRIVWE